MVTHYKRRRESHLGEKGNEFENAHLGAKGNQFENALVKQRLESFTNIKSKKAADKTCPSLEEPAKATFRNDSPAHTALTSPKSVHLVAPWCCHRNEPLLWGGCL